MKPTRGRLPPASLQGTYYLVSGIWPIIHLRSFMALTGRKHDTWLVQTFGAFIAAVGAVLVREAQGDTAGDASRRLAIATALTLATAESWFVARRRISPIYLADALVEVGLAAASLRRPSAPQSARRPAAPQ